MELQNAPCFHGRLWSAGSWLEDPRSRRGVDSCPQDHSGPLSHVIYPSNCVESGVSLLAGRNHQKGQACGFLQTRLMTFPFLKSHETFFSKKSGTRQRQFWILPLSHWPWTRGNQACIPWSQSVTDTVLTHGMLAPNWGISWGWFSRSIHLPFIHSSGWMMLKHQKLSRTFCEAQAKLKVK